MDRVRQPRPRSLGSQGTRADLPRSHACPRVGCSGQATALSHRWGGPRPDDAASESREKGARPAPRLTESSPSWVQRHTWVPVGVPLLRAPPTRLRRWGALPQASPYAEGPHSLEQLAGPGLTQVPRVHSTRRPPPTVAASPLTRGRLWGSHPQGPRGGSRGSEKL